MIFFLRKIAPLMLLMAYNYSFAQKGKYALPLKFDVPKPLPAHVNSMDHHYSMRFSPNGKRIIYSVRDKVVDHGHHKVVHQDIYEIEMDASGNWSKPILDANIFNLELENQLVGISEDENHIYLQSHNDKGYYSGVNMRRFVDGKWMDPEPVTVPELKHPPHHVEIYINDDEDVMIFSMHLKHDHGKRDLYVCVKNNYGAWGKIQNIGFQINTTGNEYSPWLSPDKRTLFFSSDGHFGMGNSDIFKSTRLGSGWDHWSIPENLGNQVNSVGNDAGFCINNDNEVIFIRNADSDSSKIYSSKLLPTKYNRHLFYDLRKNRLVFSNKNLPTVAGKIRDHAGHFISGSKIELINLRTKAKKTIEANSKGDFKENLEVDENYMIVVNHDGYFQSESEFSTKGENKSQDFNLIIYMEPSGSNVATNSNLSAEERLALLKKERDKMILARDNNEDTKTKESEEAARLAKIEAEKKAEADRLAKLEADKKAKEEARLAQLEKERQAKEEAARLAKIEADKKAEADRIAKLEADKKAKDEARLAQLEKERQVKEEAERLAKIEADKKAEADRLAKLEADKKAKEETRLAQLEKERQAKEEAARLAKIEADKKAEADRLANLEADKKAKEEARLAQLEKERQAKEEADRLAKLEADKKAKEEARLAQLEKERQAKEEAERLAKIEADKKAEADRLAKLETDKKAKEEARLAQLEKERQAKEEAARLAKIEADKKAEADRLAKLEADKKAKEEARLAQLEKERQAKEEAARLAKIEADKKAEADRLAKLEADKKAKEEARLAQLEKERQAKEETARLAKIEADKKALEKSKNDKYNRFLEYARKAIANQELDKAKSDLNAALSIKPGASEATAEMKKLNGLIAEKEKQDLIDKDYDKYMSQGNGYLINKEYDQAETLFNKALALKPGDDEAKYKLKQIDIDKRHDTELASLENRQAPKSQRQIDALIAKQKAEEEAKANFEKEYKDALHSGNDALLQRNFADAKSSYQKALSLKPDNEKLKSKIIEIDELLAKEEEIESKRGQFTITEKRHAGSTTADSIILVSKGADQIVGEINSNPQIKGIVQDGESKEPLKAALVYIKNTKTQETQKLMSLANGKFNFNLPSESTYELKVIRRGYNTYLQEFNTFGKNGNDIVSLQVDLTVK